MPGPVGSRGERGHHVAATGQRAKAVTALSALWSGTRPGLGHWANTPVGDRPLSILL